MASPAPESTVSKTGYIKMYSFGLKIKDCVLFHLSYTIWSLIQDIHEDLSPYCWKTMIFENFDGQLRVYFDG